MAGALTVSFGIQGLLGLPKILGAAMKPGGGPSPKNVELLCEYSEKARKDGILSLEDIIDELEDPILKKGLRLVVDGTESEVISTILENDIYVYEAKAKEQAAVMDAAGGFCPTMGIIGTVTGLVLVLGNLGGDASALGHSIASAFIATLYGIGFANILFLPAGTNLKGKIKREKLGMEMTIMGVLAIQQGESPALVKEKIIGFLEEKEQKELEASAGGGE